MSLGRVLRVLLAAALLSAQHAALAHGLWHSVDQKSQPAQKQLCGQHDALGTVAGAVCGIALTSPAEAPQSRAAPTIPQRTLSRLERDPTLEG